MNKQLLLLILFLFHAALGFAGQKNIFFLHTYPGTLPWTKNLNAGIEEALSRQHDWVLYSEYMDIPRLGHTLSDQQWGEYFNLKYASVKFDVVMAESSQACRFIHDNGKQIFGDIPTVLFSSEDLEPLSNTYYLKSQQDQAVIDTFNLALKQNPRREKIIIIHNQPGFYEAELHDLMKLADEKGLEHTLISDFTTGEMLGEIEKPGGNSILFFFPYFTDSTGERYIPRKVLADIDTLSPGPVYTFWSSLIGSGSAGGVAVDSRKIAKEMFRAAGDYFETGMYGSDYSTNRKTMDWHAVKKYHLHMDKSDREMIVLNKPQPFFSIYYKELMTLSSLVLGLFLALSLYSRSRLSRMNRKMEELYLLQDRNARMGEIMNFVAHQWQQYLYTISLYINSMEKRGGSNEYITTIKAALDSLFSTLKNFRDFMVPAENREIFSLSKQCGKVISLLEDMLSSRNIALYFEDRGSTDVWGIKNEWEQVLINLLINAANILKERRVSEPKIFLIVEGLDNDILITIEDNGGGFSGDWEKKIFRLYHTGRREGSGMGLYMSRRIIVNRFNGTMIAENSNEGACLTITIPRESGKTANR